MHLDAGDSQDFREVLAQYATGVVVVSVCADGVDHAMTANSFTSVSLEPPLVLVCVDRRARFHAAAMSADRWGVSVLGGGSRDAASWFATRGRPLRGQFAGYRTTRGEVSGAQLLDDALGWLECTTEAVYPGGDHDIMVGRVRSLRLRAAEQQSAAPLIYFRHGFRSPPAQ